MTRERHPREGGERSGIVSDEPAADAVRPVAGWSRRIASGTVRSLLGAVHRVATFSLSAVVLLLAVISWQFADGDVPIGFMNPYVRDALVQPGADFDVRVGDTVLTWAGWNRRFEVRIEDLSLIDRDGREVAAIPQMSMGFSVTALFDGELAPTGITVIAPDLRLVRDAAGEISLALGTDLFAARDGAVTPASAAGDLAALWFEEMLAPPVPGTPTAYLREITLLNADIQVDDAVWARSWTAQGATAALRRGAGGLAIEYAFGAEFGGGQMQASGRIEVDRARDVSVSARFGDVWAPDIAALDARFAELRRIHAPLDVEVDFEMPYGRTLPREVAYAVSGGEGTLYLEEWMAGPVDVLGFAVDGRFRMDRQHRPLRLEIDDAVLETPGPIMTAAGGLIWRGGEPQIDLRLGITDLRVADAATYWPTVLAPSARRWILENVLDGRITEMVGDLALTPTEIRTEDLGPDAYRLRFAFEDAVARYFPGMIPVTGAVGTGSVAQEEIRLDIAAADLDGVPLSQGQVRIDRPLEPMPPITVSFVASGDVGKKVRLINQPPLSLADRLQVDPSALGGAASTRVAFEFPIRLDLNLSHLRVAAVSNLADVTWVQPFDGVDLSDGRFNLKVDAGSVSLEGAAALNGVPFDIAWDSAFASSGPLAERYRLSGQVDEVGRANLGLPNLDFLTGPVDLTADLRLARDGTLAAQLSAGLTEAGIAVPGVPVTKPVGSPGSLLVEARAEAAGGPVTVDTFLLDSADLTVSGDGVYDPELGIRQVNLNHLRFGRTDVSAVVGPGDDGGLIVAVSGRSLDLEPYLTQWLEAGTAAAAADPVRAVPGPPLSVRARVETVHLTEDRAIVDVRAEGFHDGARLARGTLTAAVGAARTGFDMDMVETGQGRRLEIATDDAGAIVTSIFPEDRIEGGVLRFHADIDDVDEGAPVTGALRVEDFRLVRAPVLAQALQAGSLFGIFELLNGDGIGFIELDAPFAYSGGRVMFEDAKAYGPTMGFTMRGSVDPEADTVLLDGTIVPAYAVNALFSRLPVIGAVLGGREGEGVIGIRYKIDGEVTQPTVTVNPLSAFAPGFLRNLFPFVGEVEDPEATVIQ